MTRRILTAAALAMCCSPAFAATPPQTQGGSMQVSGQPGCMNQWMFNGVWRVRVTNVAWHPATAPPGVNGWDVTMQWGNGTARAGLKPADTMKQPMVLALSNGDTMTTSDTPQGTLNEQQLDNHAFPASGQFTYSQTFLSVPALDQNNKPAKLLVTFDVPKYRQVYGKSATLFRQKTPGYNYRIDLTCSK